MLRLTVELHTPEEVRLKVEGRVAGESVVLLEQEASRWLQESARLVLDLTGVQFIDREGIACMKRCSEGRLVLFGGSPFIRALLAKHGLN